MVERGGAAFPGWEYRLCDQVRPGENYAEKGCGGARSAMQGGKCWDAEDSGN